MTPAVTSYYSLHPAETFSWKKADECCCLGKTALRIASVIAIPLELLGRLFANMSIAVYLLFQPHALEPNPPEFFVSDVPATIFDAVQCLPVERLPQAAIYQKFLGALWGQVLGDALGMFTEFLTREQAQSKRPANLEFSDRKLFSRPHVNRFPWDGWTDDSDQFFLIARSLWEHSRDPTTPKEILFAKQILNWRHHGLDDFSSQKDITFISRQADSSTDPYRKNIGCQGLGAMTYDVLKKPNFLKDPHAAALSVWKEGNKKLQVRPAANGALMRTAIIGLVHRDLNQAVKDTILYAKVTHADPRCIASAVALTAAITLLLGGASPEDAISHAEDIATSVLWEEMEILKEHINDAEKNQWRTITNSFATELHECMDASLDKLKLGEGLIGYTFKCLGAAFYALRKAVSLKGSAPDQIFRTVLEEIIFEGGDADTNAAAAGALLGAYLGQQAIPPSWIKDLHPQDKRVLEEALSHAQSIAQTVPEDTL